MYTAVEIEHFRGIKHLRIDGLRRLNLFVGKNNCGKTSVLEAVFLLGGSAYDMVALANTRSQLNLPYPFSFDTVLRSYFYDQDPDRLIKLRGKGYGVNGLRVVEIRRNEDTQFFPPVIMNGVTTAGPNQPLTSVALTTNGVGIAGPVTSVVSVHPQTGQLQNHQGPQLPDRTRTTLVPSRFSPPPVAYAQKFSELKRFKRDQYVLAALQLIEERVQRLDVLSEAAGPAVFVDLGASSLIPLSICGDGMVRLFSVVVELLTVPGGVLLVDEIDNGLHYKVMDQLWPLIDDFCERLDVQLFATTHSEDLLDSALDAFSDKPGHFGLFRIDRRGDEHSVAFYDDEAQEGVREMHFEVRG